MHRRRFGKTKTWEGRPRSLAVSAIIVLLLLLDVWWQWPDRKPLTKPADHSASPGTMTQARMASVAISGAPGPSGRHQPAHYTEEPAPESEEALCQEQRRQQMRARQAQLQPGASPDDAIGNALLIPMTRTTAEAVADPGAQGREFRAAQRLWPDNLDLAWYALRTCSPEYGCDRQAQWLRVRALDGDNAALWIFAMEDAYYRHDTGAWENALHGAATAKIYDARHGVSFLHALPLMTDLPLPEACRTPKKMAEMEDLLGGPFMTSDLAYFLAGTFEFATGSAPGLAGLQPCRDASSLSSASRLDCLELLARVANGDTLIEQSLALSLQVQLVGNGPGHAQWRERYRRMHWLQSLAGEAFRTMHYRDTLYTEGEVAMLRKYAIAQGKWPPPDDWLPDDANGRSLILTGRPAKQGK